MFPTELDDYPEKPETFDQNSNLQLRPTSSTTLRALAFATPTTMAPPQTTKSQRFWRCMNNCPTTSEYNPICGTDVLSYHNRQKLDCTNLCGRRTNANWNSNFFIYILKLILFIDNSYILHSDSTVQAWPLWTHYPYIMSTGKNELYM